jgi:predicted ATP-grasp superfamily ATP-dependent carboligase
MPPENEHKSLTPPWLVAVWPGMGAVAAVAGAHLAASLSAKPVRALPERQFFSVDSVDVQQGIARSQRLPQSVFFRWHDPTGRRDLIIFVGEAQPERGGDAMCRRIIDLAIAEGAERVVTFAALAAAVPPTADSRVYGAVTAPELLRELRDAGIELLTEGQIGGLNGALLAAAADRGVPGMCLLGLISTAAAAVPNPGAARAVLEAFEKLSGVHVDLEPLTRQAEAMQAQIRELVSRSDGDAGAESADAEAAAKPKSKPRREHRLDADAAKRIEALFEAARQDRARAGELKRELDRLEVFDQYENRFLDLFRQAS